MRKLLYVTLCIFFIARLSYSSVGNMTQGNWRWRNDNGTDTTATFMNNENSAVTLNTNNNIRLRIELYNNDPSSNSNNNSIALFYSTTGNSGVAADWTQITTDSTSNAFVLSPSSYFYDHESNNLDFLNNSSSTNGGPDIMVESGSPFSLIIQNNTSNEVEYCIKATNNALTNTTYYFEVRVVNVSPSSELDGYSGLPSLTTGSVLPVELTSFTTAIDKNKVKLLWKTSTEVNNYGFEILRSAQNDSHSELASASEESSNWQKIGFVKGSGNSNSPKNYSFADNKPLSGKAEYRLKQIDNNGQFKYSKVLTVSMLPTKFELYQNYPNPFNPSTIIKYDLPKQSKVVLKIYDILGHQVATLVNKEQQAGVYKVQLAADKYKLASGVYIYSLEAGKYSSIKKLILLK